MRFWITVAMFAILNLAAWAAWWQWGAPHPAILEVADLQPAADGVVTDRRTVAWQFNLAMRDDLAAGAPGDLAPAVAGTWRWSDPRTLVFTADADLPLASTWSATLDSARLATADGFRLAHDHRRTVGTEPLNLRYVQVLADDPDGSRVVALDFSDRVQPADLRAHLTVEDDDGRTLPWTVANEAQPLRGAAGPGRDRYAHLLRIGPVPIPARGTGIDVLLRLGAGLRGISGPLGLARDEARQVSFGSVVRLVEVDSEVPTKGDPALLLRFSGPVDRAALTPLLAVEPAVPFTVSETWRGLRMDGPFRCGTRYTVRVLPAPPGAKGVPQPETIGVETGDRDPGCWFDLDQGYLAARGRRTVTVHAVNLAAVSVTVTRVVPEQVVAWRISGWPERFGQPLATRRITIPPGDNTAHDVALALDTLLAPDGLQTPDGLPTKASGTTADGAYLLSVQGEPRDVTTRGGRGWYWRMSDRTMVSLSDLGLSARCGADAVHAWVLSLGGAAPQADVRLRLFSRKGQPLGEARSDGDGLARIPFTAPPGGDRPGFLVAERASATAAAPELTWLDLDGGLRDDRVDGGGRPYLRQGFEAFLYSDRGVYRPGDTVHLRALVRGPGGAAPPTFPLRLRVLRPDQRLWRTLTPQLDADGDAEVAIELPNDLPTGGWTVDAGLPGDGAPFGSLAVQVEDFLPDRLRTTLTCSGPGLAAADEAADEAAGGRRCLVAAGPLTLMLRGDWLFGDPAAGQAGSLALRLDPVRFAPAGWSGWSFGEWAGEWSGEVADRRAPAGRRLDPRSATLDAAGRTSWTLDLAQELAGAARTPWRLTATGGVGEASGRTTSATRRVVLDPCDRYLGLRAASGASAGTSCAIELRAVSTGGTPAAVDDAIEVQLLRESWSTVVVEERGQQRYVSTRRLEPVGAAQRGALDRGTGQVALAIPGAGAWLVAATDLATGQRSVLALWAGGGEWDDLHDGISRERPERCQVAVVADTRSDPTQPLVAPREPADDAPAPAASATMRWQPGAALAVVVRSPFAGRLLLTVATDRVLTTRVLAMDGPTAVVPLTVGADWGPDAWISATVVRALPAADAAPVEAAAPVAGTAPSAPAWRVHRAHGVTMLAVAEDARRAVVTVEAPSAAVPGAELPVAVRVSDAAGAPLAGAAVSVAVVDEGILRLTTFRTPDPFAYFTARRALGVLADDCYAALYPEGPPAGSPEPGGDQGLPAHRPPVAARRVRPLALWTVLRTADDGTARTAVALPAGFAGQVRIMAVADRGAASGAGEARATVRGALVLQSSWPRVATPGDRFGVPLRLSAPGRHGTVHVTLAGADGAAPLRAAAGAIDVALDADGRGAGTFDLQTGAATPAGAATGVASLRLTAELADGDPQAADGVARAVEELELPVRPAGQVQTLGEALGASPAAPLRVILPDGLLPGPDHRLRIHVGQRPALALPRGIDELYRYPHGCAEQTVSAVFPLVALPALTAELGPEWFPPEGIARRIALGVLRLQGMETAGGGLAMWQGGQEPWPWASVYAAHFLVEARRAGHAVPEDFLTRLLDYSRRLAGRTVESEQETAAYACYVLARAGRPEVAAMNRLEERRTRTPAHAGTATADVPWSDPWLAAAWAAAGRRDLAAALLPARLPAPRRARRLSGDLASPVRDAAVQALALLDAAPDHPALPALLQDLADHTTWHSTQDGAFAALALGRWRTLSPPATPWRHAVLRVDGAVVAESTDGAPLSWSGTGGTALAVEVDGPPGAAAAVDWVLTGVPLALPPDADHGLRVRRIWRDERGAEIGDRPLTAGELVQVELVVSAPLAQPNVVVEDVLPAGLEIENPRLATSAAAGDGAGRPALVDMRDDRLIVVADVPAAGNGAQPAVFAHRYLVRAVTAGTFVRPPVRAECMYDSALTSSSGTGSTTVRPRAP